MTEQYRPNDPDRTAEPEASPASHGTDILLWIILALSFAANGAMSLIGLDLLAVPFGVVALFSGVTLLIRYFQRRR